MNLAIQNQTHQPQFLLVDDSPQILRAFSIFLSKYGTVHTSVNATEAIEKMKKSKYDVVFTDYNMRNGSGLDLLKFSTINHPEVPVVMLTAYGNKFLVLEAFERSVFGFLEKPCPQDKFDEMVQKAMEETSIRKEKLKMYLSGQVFGRAAHDISTPISVVKSGLERLLSPTENMSDTKNNNREHLTKVVQRNISRSEEILHLARQTFRGDPGEISVINLSEFIHDLSDTYSLKPGNIKVQFSDIPIHAMVKVNFTQLHEVFINLINNAIQAAVQVQNSEVKVLFAESVGTYKFYIQDNGKGLDPNMEKNLFQIFQTKTENGTGFGLSIAKSIIQSYGGTLSYERTQGITSFLVSLPGYLLTE